MSDEVPIEATTAQAEGFAHRERLRQMMQDSPLPPDELMFNLGLYVRSSLLVKFLVLHDAYRRVASVPGALIEFGTWRGQNLVLLENLRAIHEPFNKQRPIIGFDTFAGYPEEAGMAAKSTETHSGYNTGGSYPDYLGELLQVHEGMNAFGHIRGGHQLIAGDVVETAPRYFADHPETLVAFAFFDMGPYEPTLAALKAILPHTVPGSVLLFDELTWAGAPGEAIAFKEVFRDLRYTIEKCQFYPSKSLVTLL
ncbi:MAG TPA: TylF/MycF/NovP-related O-methyltransferase [Phenylobacterium sp.]|jgi:Macrocin-O-methyltransferase (TylF)|nr:TylF/MycF/NovP-related O-methyltransferase [Phenylobacterium sp.]